MSRRVLQPALIVVVAVLLAAGLYRIFELRFAAGDVFPVASSRRADPLGTRALLDALARQPGLRVSRNLLPLHRVRDKPGLAVLVLGVAPENIGFPSEDPGFNTNLLRLTHAGARVVLGVQHESSALATNAFRQGIRKLASFTTTNRLQAALDARLGFQLAQGTNDPSPSPDAAPVARLQATSAVLPAELPWPSPWHITGTSNAWSVLYDVQNQPVVAERSWGKGSFVLMASDYLLSNEALRRIPQPALASWLLGDATEVIFDETHLGLTFEPGMASLIRRYQLGGAVTGLAVLLGLYLWRTMARFNPPPSAAAPDDALPGRGTSEAFLALLQRALHPDTVVAECMAHWRASQGRHPRVGPRRVADAQDLLNVEMERPPKARDPIGTYRRIAALLRQRTHR